MNNPVYKTKGEFTSWLKTTIKYAVYGVVAYWALTTFVCKKEAKAEMINQPVAYHQAENQYEQNKVKAVKQVASLLENKVQQNYVN